MIKSRIENISNNFMKRIKEDNIIVKTLSINPSQIFILSNDFSDFDTEDSVWMKTNYNTVVKTQTSTIKSLFVMINHCPDENLYNTKVGKYLVPYYWYTSKEDDNITSDLINNIYHKIIKSLCSHISNNPLLLNTWTVRWHKKKNNSAIGFCITRELVSILSLKGYVDKR